MNKSSEDFDDSSGVYCFFPFERFDGMDSGVMKIGNTEKTFQDRLGAYHTYFVGGVWVLAFLKVYPKRGKQVPPNFKHILNTIEDYALKQIEMNGGVIIFDKRRRWKKGQSEWVYTNPYVVKKCFQSTITHFKTIYPELSFMLDTYKDLNKTIKEINASYNRNILLKNKFVGEYIFNLKH